jgi:hypothetical protein
MVFGVKKSGLWGWISVKLTPTKDWHAKDLPGFAMHQLHRLAVSSVSALREYLIRQLMDGSIAQGYRPFASGGSCLAQVASEGTDVSF